MNNQDVLVIVPLFNESENIKNVIDDLKKYFDQILVIEDGSEDNSLNILKKLDVKLIVHEINLGQGAAIETGFNYLIKNKQYNYAVTFDGDGQNFPLDAAIMTKIAKEKSLDAVIGSRFLRNEDQKEMPILRRLILKLANYYEKIFYSVKFSDAHNGLRVLKKTFVERSLLPLVHHDMSHATEISYKICKNTHRFLEYPITVKYKNKRTQSLLNAVNIFFINLFKPFT